MQNDETGVYVQVWNNNVQRTGRHTVKRQNAVRNKNRRKERANRRDDGNATKISAVSLSFGPRRSPCISTLSPFNDRPRFDAMPKV